VASLLLAAALLANGGTLRVADAPMGAYRVSVYTDPTPARTDSLDVSILIVREGDPSTVADLDVRVEAELVEAREDAVVAAAPTILRVVADRGQAEDPRYYAAKFAPSVPGKWSIVVSVDGPEGRGRVEFPLDVREPGPLDRPSVVLVLALTPLAILAWWLTRGGPAEAHPDESSGGQVEG
jgi:hypothetical protein